MNQDQITIKKFYGQVNKGITLVYLGPFQST